MVSIPTSDDASTGGADRGSLPFTARQSYSILGVAVLGTFLDGVDFLIFLFFLPPLMDEFDVSLATLSYVHAASFVAGIVGALIFGQISDRLGRRPALALSIATYSGFILLSAFAHSFELFVIARLLTGVGLGGETGVAFAIVNEAFPGEKARRGAASALLQCMFPLGGVAAAWLYAETTLAVGADAWRWSFGLLGSGLILAAITPFIIPESRLWLESRARRATRSDGPSLLALLRQPPLPRIMLVATLMLTAACFGLFVPSTFAPAMWQTVYHLSPQMVAALGVAAGLIGAAAFLAAGALSDRFGRRRVFASLAGFNLLAYILFALAIGLESSAWSVIIAFNLILVGGGFFGVQGSWMSELLPIEVRATAFNLVYYTARAIGGGLAPALALSTATSLGLGIGHAIAFGGAGIALAIALSFALPETRTKRL